MGRMLTSRVALVASLFAASLSAATVELVAGGGTGDPGVGAHDIRFVEPFGVAFDRAGNLYVIEYKGNRLIKIDAAGRTSLVAGADAFNEPHAIVANGDEMFIADTHNNRVLRMDVASGEMVSVAGNGQKGFSGDGGPATDAAFNGIYAIDLAPDGENLYVADLTNRRVRRIDLKSGVVTTVAGNGEQGVPQDGALAAAGPLVDPRAVTADAEGNVYILERRGNALRVVDKGGRIRTLIKPGDITPDLNGPKHLCIDQNGNVIIADAENHLLRLYNTRTGVTTTIMGTGEAGDGTNAADPLRTQLRRPHGVYVNSDGVLYVSDSYNHRILKAVGF
jgi:DNA-binding beta-propeller fold protein YncE